MAENWQTNESVCLDAGMPDTPAQTARGAAARERVLEAATGEFARFGIAGARVDRILKHARTSKAQFYDYFGGKEQLFDAVFEASLQRLLIVVPIGGDDLADWALRLYDDCLAQPDLIRIATWHRLERRPSGTLTARLANPEDPNLRAVARAQASGSVVHADALDVMAIVIAMAMAWSPVSNVYVATVDEDPVVHLQRRALLHHCVSAAVAGPGGRPEASLR